MAESHFGRLAIPVGRDGTGLLGKWRDLCRLRQADQPRTLAGPLIVGAPDYNLAIQDDAIEAGEPSWHFDDLDGIAMEATEVHDC